MKPTDIPNGFVVLGPGRQNILMDFDDKGKVENKAVEISIEGWPDTTMVKGKVRADVLILVHTVKGDSSMLVKRLSAHQLMRAGNSILVSEVVRMGMLNTMAEKVYRDYMVEMEKKERLRVQIEEAEKGKT